MKLTLMRTPPTNGYVVSALRVDGYFMCYTMEDPRLLVPYGIYDMRVDDTLRLLGTDPVNVFFCASPDDIKYGHIIPGYTINKARPGISRCRHAFDDLNRILQEAASDGEQIYIEITTLDGEDLNGNDD